MVSAVRTLTLVIVISLRNILGLWDFQKALFKKLKFRSIKTREGAYISEISV